MLRLKRKTWEYSLFIWLTMCSRPFWAEGSSWSRFSIFQEICPNRFMWIHQSNIMPQCGPPTSLWRAETALCPGQSQRLCRRPTGLLMTLGAPVSPAVAPCPEYSRLCLFLVTPPQRLPSHTPRLITWDSAEAFWLITIFYLSCLNCVLCSP